MSIGSTLYEKGSTAVAVVGSNEYVSYSTNKSKEAIGQVGGAVVGMSSVNIINK